MPRNKPVRANWDQKENTGKGWPASYSRKTRQFLVISEEGWVCSRVFERTFSFKIEK